MALSRFRVNIQCQSKKKNTNNETLRLLYVSTVKKYKHQWNLIDAVGLLRKDGIPIELHLVGGGDSPALNLMQDAIHRNKSDKNFIFYHGILPNEQTLEWYLKADIFVFPSSCETFGISLLEAMTAGLPIASSGLASPPASPPEFPDLMVRRNPTVAAWRSA